VRWVPGSRANNLDVIGLSRTVAACLIVVALAACTGEPRNLPAAAGEPLAAAKGGDLLYASTIEGRVFAFSYPSGGIASTFQIQSSADVWGACADASGNVFFTIEESATSSRIDEYAHGGTTPIGSLRDDGYVAADCASDPASGDLAVTSFDAASGASNVAIYRKARGKPARFSDAALTVQFCAYDGQGDLFVDGTGKHQLAELPKAARAFRTIALSAQLVRPAGVEWDGTDLAIEDNGFHRKDAAIDRVQIANSRGTIIGTTHLRGLANRGATFWIAGGDVVTSGGQQGNRVGRWNYPPGGRVLKIFRGEKIRGQTLYGVTISNAE